ncbi:MAG: universal stress protein [archaeon]
MKVLLGIVSDDRYSQALEETIERARVAGDDLTVALVDDPGASMDADAVGGAIEETLADASIDADVRYIDGDPGSRLVEIAETEGFDRIVLSGGQTSPMGKIRIGTTVEFVLLNSHTSVTLIR